jgi:hypothetical protein
MKNFKSKTTAQLVAALVVLLAVAGCDNGEVTSSSGFYGGDVVETTLKDGTRCAVFVGSYKGGVSCDWRGL